MLAGITAFLDESRTGVDHRGHDVIGGFINGVYSKWLLEGQVIRRVSAVPLEANNAALVPAIGPSQPRPHMS